MNGELQVNESSTDTVEFSFPSGIGHTVTNDTIAVGRDNTTRDGNGLATATLALKQIFPPFLIILGTTGNVLGIILLQRSRRLNQLSVAYYLKLFFVSSTLVLFFGAGQDWLCNVANLPFIWDIADSLCRLWEFFSNALFYYPIWLVVTMIADRYLSVSGRNTHCNVFFAKVTAIGLLVCLVTVSVHALWTFELHRKYGCSIPSKRKDFHSLIWPWISAVIYSFVPPVLITTFTVMLIIAIYTERKRQARIQANSLVDGSHDNLILTPESGANNLFLTSERGTNDLTLTSESADHNDNLTVMSIAVALTCLICTTPATTMNVYMMKVPTTWIYAPNTVFELELISQVFQVLAVLNHSVMPIVCFVTSPLLRKEAYSIFIKKGISTEKTEHGLISFCNDADDVNATSIVTAL